VATCVADVNHATGGLCRPPIALWVARSGVDAVSTRTVISNFLWAKCCCRHPHSSPGGAVWVWGGLLARPRDAHGLDRCAGPPNAKPPPPPHPRTQLRTCWTVDGAIFSHSTGHTTMAPRPFCQGRFGGDGSSSMRSKRVQAHRTMHACYAKAINRFHTTMQPSRHVVSKQCNVAICVSRAVTAVIVCALQCGCSCGAGGPKTGVLSGQCHQMCALPHVALM
jgi:hypothetical protein